MRPYLLLFVFVFYCQVGLSQTSYVDTLKNKLLNEKDPSRRLACLVKLCAQDDNLTADTLLRYGMLARQLATQLKITDYYSLGTIAVAEAYERWDNIDSARALIFPEAAKYNVKDPQTRSMYFRLARAKIDVMGAASDYKNGLALVFQTLSLAERYLDSVTIAENMNTIAAWYYDMDRLDAAREWSYRALANTTSQDKFILTRAAIYLNLGENYRWVGKEDSALICINIARHLSEQAADIYMLSVAYQRLTGILVSQEKYQDARKAILFSLELIRRRDGMIPQPDKLIVLASVYEHMKQYGNAIAVLRQGIMADSIYKKNLKYSEKKNVDDLQNLFYYDELAKCYKLQRDHTNYEKTLENIIAGKDAFYKANSASAIAELEAKYDFQKQQTTIAKQNLVISHKNDLLYTTFICLLLVFIIFWLIWKNAKQSQKRKVEQLQEKERIHSAKAIADAQESERKRIAADLHDNLGAQLSFIKRNVDFVLEPPQSFGIEDERKYLVLVNETARHAMIDLRETLWVLNTDEVFIQSFADKLKSYLQQYLVAKKSIHLHFTDAIVNNWKLSSSEVMHLFRIFQEVVSNVIKHADATELAVLLKTNGEDYIFVIRDNGVGFDISYNSAGHYGLENMKKRARDIGADFDLRSSADGTTIVLSKNAANTCELLDSQIRINSFKQ